MTDIRIACESVRSGRWRDNPAAENGFRRGREPGRRPTDAPGSPGLRRHARGPARDPQSSYRPPREHAPNRPVMTGRRDRPGAGRRGVFATVVPIPLKADRSDDRPWDDKRKLVGSEPGGVCWTDE